MAEETPAPPSQVPPSQTPPSRGWGFWGTVSAVLLIAAAIVVFNAPREPESVAHVRAFLTAIREGRVDDAFALAGTPKPTGPRARFLTADALRDDWEIVALDEELHLDAYGDDSPEEAQVGVAIRAPGGATADSELTLKNQDGEWRIEKPLIELEFRPGTLLYADVNGVKTPLELGVEATEYELLPGAYRFYGDVRGVARVASKPVPLLPGVVPPDLDPGVTLTRDGERAAQAALKAYIDRCVRTIELAPRRCPFGADPGIGPQGAEYRSASDFRDISWKVEEYPEAALVTDGLIRFADRRRGAVKATVTATEDDSREVTYSVTCEMRLNGYELAIGHDGKVVVLPPYARSEDADKAPPVESCRR
jgi:hypothetical protein